MNWGGTLQTAFVRGLYAAGLTFLLTWLTAMQGGASDRDALITAGIAGVTTLAMRGGVEGAFDAGRQKAGDVKQADVQPGDAGTP